MFYLCAAFPSGPRAPRGRNWAAHARNQRVAEAQPWDSRHWLNCTERKDGAGRLLTPALGTLFGVAFLGVLLLSLSCWYLAKLGVKAPWMCTGFVGLFQGEAGIAVGALGGPVLGGHHLTEGSVHPL